ncbi:hypothetical protein F4778DRAFT_358867 [Xylariomycetidae sp. FL2044]|nr:hypothetical protein F4778DRAFT_358867 [Xylariomycetidae sp. FL2044]
MFVFSFFPFPFSFLLLHFSCLPHPWVYAFFLSPLFSVSSPTFSFSFPFSFAYSIFPPFCFARNQTYGLFFLLLDII